MEETGSGWWTARCETDKNLHNKVFVSRFVDFIFFLWKPILSSIKMFRFRNERFIVNKILSYFYLC